MNRRSERRRFIRQKPRLPLPVPLPASPTALARIPVPGSVTRMRLFLLSILACATALPAQDTKPADVTGLIMRLRSSRTRADDHRDIVDQLLGLGERGARALHVYAHGEFRKRHAEFLKSKQHYLSQFEKAAVKTLRAKQGKGSKARIAELQKRAVRLSRSSGLSKSVIHEKIDPIHAELAKLLNVWPDEVLAAHADVREADAELRTAIEELKQIRQWVDEAAGILERTDDGKRYLKRQHPLPSPESYAEELTAAEQRLAVLAMPMTKYDRKTLLRNEADKNEIGVEEYAGILDLNVIRLRAGLRVLRIDVKLCNAARGHSGDMQRLGFFSHTSPVKGKETPGKRAALAGTSAGAENIARGARTGPGAIQQWWYSPGHHRNMMGGGGRVGLGQVGSYWTQMFGG